MIMFITRMHFSKYLILQIQGELDESTQRTDSLLIKRANTNKYNFAFGGMVKDFSGQVYHGLHPARV